MHLCIFFPMAATKMTPRKARNVIAAMRSQRLDVRLGIWAPAQWAAAFDATEGVEWPVDLVTYRADITD